MHRKTRYPLAIMHLKGTEVEMGRQYGEMLLEMGGYQEVLDFYPTMAETMLLQGFPREMRKSWLTRLGKPLLDWGLNSLNNQRPEQFSLRTSEALRAGKIAPALARFINVMDLFQNSVATVSRLGMVRKRSHYVPQFLPACSTAMVWGEASKDGQLMHARNFDFPGLGIWDEAPCVVFCTPADGIPFGYVSARGAEVPGVSCFNEEGITITFHTRLSQDVGFDGIGAVDLGHTIIKNAKTLDEAVKIAGVFKIASTWGIAISSAKEKRSIVIETTRKGISVIEPQYPEAQVNTNHYYSEQHKNNEIATSSTFAQHSYSREQRMCQIIEAAQPQGGCTVTDMQQMLGDNREHEGELRAMGSTLAQLISVMSMVVKPEASKLFLSAGQAPTGWGPYAEVDLQYGQEPGLHIVEVDGTSNHHYVTESKKNQAYQHYRAAALADLNEHNTELVNSYIGQAIDLDAKEPSYRFLAGALALETGNFSQARLHFEEGLSNETSGFRQGQFQYWLGRLALQQGRTSEARARLQSLQDLNHAFLAAEVTTLQKEINAGRPSKDLKSIIPNFMLIDAA